MNNQNKDLLDLEKKLLEKQEKIDKEKEAIDKEKEIIRKTQEEYASKLEKAGGVTAEEAKRTSDKKAREVVVEAMRHGAVNYIPEYTVSIVKIADEEIKGRIIGKEGRNIRAFEQATGADVDLDEEGIIRLSSFDQIRREVARRALEKLIKDTRVQP